MRPLVYLKNLIFVCLVSILATFQNKVHAQNFVVTNFNANGYPTCPSSCPFSGSCIPWGSTYSSVNTNGSGRPVSVTTNSSTAGYTGTYDEYGNPIWYLYTDQCTYDLPPLDCYSDDNISWEPAPPPISGSSPKGYCSYETITLNATDVYLSYVWQYSTQTGVWNTLTSSTGSTLTVGIQDIFGASYLSHLNQNIYFRYSVAGCNPVSDPTGAY